MRRIQEATGQPINKQKMEGLYLKYINLAKDAQKREDWVLSESYYQRAEYYLHAINYPSDDLPVVTSFPIRKPHSVNQAKLPPQQAKALPFKGNFLRRNRRNIQG